MSSLMSVPSTKICPAPCEGHDARSGQVRLLAVASYLFKGIPVTKSRSFGLLRRHFFHQFLQVEE